MLTHTRRTVVTTTHTSSARHHLRLRSNNQTTLRGRSVRPKSLGARPNAFSRREERRFQLCAARVRLPSYDLPSSIDLGHAAANKTAHHEVRKISQGIFSSTDVQQCDRDEGPPLLRDPQLPRGLRLPRTELKSEDAALAGVIPCIGLLSVD